MVILTKDYHRFLKIFSNRQKLLKESGGINIDIFLLKKIAGAILMPLPLGLLMAGVGLVMLWCTQRQKVGKVLTTVAVVFLGAASYGPVSDRLLSSVEHQYPPFVELDSLESIHWVVVLGGGHVSDPSIPITSQVGKTSLVRLNEGLRILQQIHEGRLLLSGGKVFDPVSNAEMMARIAIALGFPKEKIVLATTPKDTAEEAQAIYQKIGSSPFVLVTSASHMPRAMFIFQRLGMHPIPAPTNHLVRKRQDGRPLDFLPNSLNLHKTERAFYEHLGLLWEQIRGLR